MANNSECALSQASGYTSNSNTTNNFGLNPIESIELDSVTYGADLSERLEVINGNFNKIIESDFLRGAPGRSVSISTWVFNNETKDTDIGQSLVDAIMSNNPSTTTTTPEIDPLTSVIVGALIGKEIKVIYDEDGEIVSSLPFTFIDPRFSNAATLNESLADETDLSCVLVYENTTDSAGFVAAQTFPTLYWDTDIDGGNFCWKINGQKTGLSCKGPRGNDGSGGTLYTVIYNAEAEVNTANGSSAREIIGAMWLNSSNVSDIKNEFIPKNEFAAKQISIKTGDTVIALPGVIDGSGNISFATPSDSSIGTTITSDTSAYEYSITTAFVHDDKYYIVISGDTIRIPYVLQGGTLSNLMNMIGDPYMLGMYIPSEKENGSITKAHTLWSDRVNPSNFCIGEVKYPAGVNDYVENPTLAENSSVSLLYDKMSVGKDGNNTKAVTKITKSATTDIVEMYPESSQYQTIEVDRFKDGYWIDNIFTTAHRVIGGTYDFYSAYNGRENNYFGIYQPVKIGEVLRYAARITSDVGEIFYILWGDLDNFISLLDKWYTCINQENEGNYPPPHNVQIFELNNLRIEDHDWVCDSATQRNSSDIQWNIVYEHKDDLLIERVTCDNVHIQGRNALGFVYTFKDNTGATHEFVSRTLPVNKNENDRCILPVYPYEVSGYDYCVPFVITGFRGTSSRIKVENVCILSEGENSFDVHATQNLYHQYYRPYIHGARLFENYHQYEGDFDQYYKVKSKDVGVEAKNVSVEATDINIESTRSRIESKQHRVGHLPLINGGFENLTSFKGAIIQPKIYMDMSDLSGNFGQTVEYCLYIPLCVLTVNNARGYASVYKMATNNGSGLPSHLVLWSMASECINDFYKTYYKIQSSNRPQVTPAPTRAELEKIGVTVYLGFLSEPPYDTSVDMTRIPEQKSLTLGGAYPTLSQQKTFGRDNVLRYTDRIEWVEQNTSPNSYKKYTINLTPDEISAGILAGSGMVIIAKDISETRSQDPSKYVVIMCGHANQAQPLYENLGETYSYNPLFLDFKNIYKYDEDGQDSFNKVLSINRAGVTFPNTDSYCETWQERVITRGSEIKNDCNEYSVYCNQFFVNGIDIVPLLPKLQELVSSSNS